MNYRPWALLLCIACTGQDTTETDPDSSRESVRGVRICELNELILQDDMLGIRVWNNLNIHDCPDDWLAQIDPQTYAVGGPRWRSIDQVVPIGESDSPPESQEIPAGLGYQMVQAATVSLFELSVLEEQLGGDPIESIEDIPAVAIAMLHEATLRSSDYRISEVSRGFSTEFNHYAGQEVFVLDDGTCQYAMKYFTSIFDSALVDEDAIATLGDRFTNLPDGYSFSVQTFDEDLVITETEGIQFVLTDEFGNSYDRFACD